jgi:hypothetical protein
MRRNGSPFFAQFLDIGPRDIVPAPCKSGADKVEVFAEIFQIVHGSLFKKNDWNLASEFQRVNETAS